MVTIVEFETLPICRGCHRRWRAISKQTFRFETDDFCKAKCVGCGATTYGEGEVPCQRVADDDRRCTRKATMEYSYAFEEATLLCPPAFGDYS